MTWNQYRETLLRPAVLISLGAWFFHTTYRFYRRPLLDLEWYLPYLCFAASVVFFWQGFVASDEKVSRATGCQLMVFGLLFLMGIAFEGKQSWDRHHWPSIEATVIDREYHRGEGARANGARIQLVYESSGQMRTAVTIVAGYAAKDVFPGSKQTVRVDPVDPDQFELDIPRASGADRLLLTGALLGLVLVIAGFDQVT